MPYLLIFALLGVLLIVLPILTACFLNFGALTDVPDDYEPEDPLTNDDHWLH